MLFPNVTGTLILPANRDWLPIPAEDVYIECDTSSAPVNITLPDISGWNTKKNVKFYISDTSRNAATNPITITAASPCLINGGSSVVINTNGETGYIFITGMTDYLYLSSTSGSSNKSSIVTTDVSLVPTAMPLMIPVAEDQVVNIISQLTGVAQSGKIYSVVINRTILGVASTPPGGIVPVGNAFEVSKQTQGAPVFAVDYTETDATGFIQVTHEAGEIITWTIKEIYC